MGNKALIVGARDVRRLVELTPQAMTISGQRIGKTVYGVGETVWVREGWWQLGRWSLKSYYAEGDDPSDYYWCGVEPIDRAPLPAEAWSRRNVRQHVPVYSAAGIAQVCRIGIRYQADCAPVPELPEGWRDHIWCWRKRPALQLPRWASRLTLTIEEVVEETPAGIWLVVRKQRAEFSEGNDESNSATVRAVASDASAGARG